VYSIHCNYILRRRTLLNVSNCSGVKRVISVPRSRLQSHGLDSSFLSQMLRVQSSSVAGNVTDVTFSQVYVSASTRTQEDTLPAGVMASFTVESPDWTHLSPREMPSVSSRESIASSRNSKMQRQDSFSINVEEDPDEAASTSGDSPSRGFGGSMQGLILLNVGAALFGSNQV
jgi:hypothetical protein